MNQTYVALASLERRPIGLPMGDATVVYIIDDDESLRAVIGSLLRSVGLQTRTYASVGAFLAASRPDAAA
jgi:FixJ family two-component response regulator